MNIQKAMKKLTTLSPGRLEEIAVITFFILFFILTITAESSAQVNGNQTTINSRSISTR